MKKILISVVISAYNEGEKIARCLQSVDWADEIIVVDNESTDKTKEIAKRLGATVYTQKNNPLAIDIQKNFGISKANGEWILVLDADEEVTPELAEEIKEKIGNSDVVGYWLPRKNIIFGKWIEHTGWYPDKQLRLLKKGKGKYTQEHVHENIAIDGNVAFLQHPLLHYNYQTIYQFLHRTLTLYAPNEAESLIRKGYVFSYADAIRFPAREFLSRYFAREGYKDGFYGLMLSLLMATYHLAIFAYLWEKNRFPQKDEVTKELLQEVRTLSSDSKYWMQTMRIAGEKNLFKKLVLRAKRKIRV